MPELSLSQLLLMAAFIVPGAVSIKIYYLVTPSKEDGLKDIIVEAVTFSIINFSLLFFPITYAVSADVLYQHEVWSYIILIFCFFVAPAFWPFLIVKLLRLMEKINLIRPRARTAWDHYFNSLQKGSFIIVQLNDGSLVGGKFGTYSYASSYPDPGHLFLEEVWEVGQDSNFTGYIFQGRGLILRPTDYKYLWVST